MNSRFKTEIYKEAKMATTIYDIAKKVNTSATTVSLALRGSSKISSVTVEKIKKVALELDYRPNAMARGLVGSCTKTLAFVFNYPTLDLANDRSFMQIFHDFAQYAQSRQYRVLFHSVSNIMTMDEIVAEMRSYGVGGMLLVSDMDDHSKKAISKSGFPTVLIGRDCVAARVSCVMLDGKNGAIQAVEYLHKLGHRRIAFVGRMPNREVSIQRLSGYLEGLQKLGIELDESLIFESAFDLDSGELAGLKLAKLRPMPTAVLAAGDMLAFGIIGGLREKGVSVPADVSIIGFDNIDLGRISYPTLSTVDLSRKEAAARAAEQLIDVMSNEGCGQRDVVKSKLIIRDSTTEVRAE
jgi:DNA-binding LacI/PurR family transcriptional regulator